MRYFRVRRKVVTRASYITGAAEALTNIGRFSTRAVDRDTFFQKDDCRYGFNRAFLIAGEKSPKKLFFNHESPTAQSISLLLFRLQFAR